MSRPADPRRAMRELSLGLSAMMPFARAGTSSSIEGSMAVAQAKQTLEAHRRVDALPWVAALEVSATHLTTGEIDALQAGAPPDPFLLSMSSASAWLLHLPHEVPDDAAALGPGLSALFKLARENGFTYVRVDDDAAPVLALEVYA